MPQPLISTIDARPWRPSLRRGRRLGPILIISLWLHLSALLIAIISVQYAHHDEELPPPSTVAMVFEGGKPEGPAVPNPQPLAPAPSAPPIPPIPPPTPPPLSAPTPQAVAPPPLAPPAPSLPLPLPPPPAPPPLAPTSPVPPPPPPVAMTIPIPVPPPLRPPPQQTPQQQAQPQPRPAPPRTAPPAASSFPAPTNFSFGPPQPQQQSQSQPRNSSRSSRAIDFSLAPREGATDLSPFSRVAGAHVGADWRNELAAWVRAHAYYPEQAAMNGEDGSVMVRVMANPNGHVTSVELRSKSGSMWLDMALQALFRDANLPPLHEENEPITFDFTMHYILIRR